LRIHESLMEQALMSPVGYQFLLHLAPRIDKVLIPPTNGRLSSAGIGRVGLVTTTGAKSGLQRTHPLTLIKDSDGLLAIGSNYGRAKHPGLERQPAGASRMHGRVHGSDRAIPSRAAHRRCPRVGMGHGYRLLRRLRALPGQLRTARDQGLSSATCQLRRRIGLGDLRCSRPVQLLVSVRSLTAHERPFRW
jgi:F420H(2)-dependent quinone reductase